MLIKSSITLSESCLAMDVCVTNSSPRDLTFNILFHNYLRVSVRHHMHLFPSFQIDANETQGSSKFCISGLQGMTRREKDGSNGIQLRAIDVELKGELDEVFSDILEPVSVQSAEEGMNRGTIATVKQKGLSDIGM